MRKSKKTIYYKRKRKGLTNYKKRLKLLLSNRMRLVVRKSLNHIIAQIIEYGANGDCVLESAHSSQLKKMGWKYDCGNVPSAYLTGILLGLRANNKKINNLILDAGMNKPTRGCRIYAVLKGALDFGIKVAHSDEVLPSEERICGKHIEAYAQLLKNDKSKFERQFNKYLSSNINAEEFSKDFNEFKNKLMRDKS